MSRDNLDLDLGMAILSTYDADGFLGIGVDVPGYETAGTGTFDARFPFGTFGRPRDPDVSADQSSRLGATALFGFAGRDRHAWVLDDPRVWPKLPQAPKGTWGAFGDTGREEITVMVLDGATGSFALRVPHSTGGGVASRVLVDVETPGAEEIVLAHGGGCEVRVRSSEAIVGDVLLATALAKAASVEDIRVALAGLATSLQGLVGPLTPLNALGTALQNALPSSVDIPTTKLRSE